MSLFNVYIYYIIYYMTFSIRYMFIDVIFTRCILWETLGHLHGDLHLSHLGRLWPLHGSDGDRDRPVLPLGGCDSHRKMEKLGKKHEKTWKSHRNDGNDMKWCLGASCCTTHQDFSWKLTVQGCIPLLWRWMLETTTAQPWVMILRLHCSATFHRVAKSRGTLES